MVTFLRTFVIHKKKPGQGSRRAGRVRVEQELNIQI
jgi:hypothetical protein